VSPHFADGRTIVCLRTPSGRTRPTTWTRHLTKLGVIDPAIIDTRSVCARTLLTAIDPGPDRIRMLVSKSGFGKLSVALRAQAQGRRIDALLVVRTVAIHACDDLHSIVVEMIDATEGPNPLQRLSVSREAVPSTGDVICGTQHGCRKDPQTCDDERSDGN
jgi:hypothetical protein